MRTILSTTPNVTQTSTCPKAVVSANTEKLEGSSSLSLVPHAVLQAPIIMLKPNAPKKPLDTGNGRNIRSLASRRAPRKSINMPDNIPTTIILKMSRYEASGSARSCLVAISEAMRVLSSGTWAEELPTISPRMPFVQVLRMLIPCPTIPDHSIDLRPISRNIASLSLKM
mmetsp:Transcript_29167/g.57290  ORF Transcript_29167/g.57290 Transcript_29167/m.57290 type:complete len:170 (+) Transcript_29167:889-1398(+)